MVAPQTVNIQLDKPKFQCFRYQRIQLLTHDHDRQLMNERSDI